jgi:hypothetical protein
MTGYLDRLKLFSRSMIMHSKAFVAISASLGITLAIGSGIAFAQSPAPLASAEKAVGQLGSSKGERLISDDQVRAAISKITGVADLEAERKTAPSSAWIQRDQRDIDQEISQQLDELSVTLGSSNAVRSWRAVRERQRELATKRTEIDRLVQEAELSPSRRTELNQKIDAARAEADSLSERIAVAKHAAKENVRKAGLDLSDSQLESLSASVISDDLVDLITRVNNLGTLLEKLSDGVRNGTRTPDTQRRYYGAVVVVQKIALAVQQRYFAKIENKYLPFVDDMITAATRASDEATKLRRGENNADRIKVLDANQKAQKLTIQAARLYRQQLESQRDYIRNAISESERTVNVAINTRDTVTVSLDLLANMDASQDLFRLGSGPIKAFERAAVL